MNVVFPDYAVVDPQGDKSAAERFFRFLGENNYRWSNPGDAVRAMNRDYWTNSEQCFDIEKPDRVYHEDRNFYVDGGYEADMPEGPKPGDPWFMCSVDGFISMCCGLSLDSDFEPCSSYDISAMLMGGV